VHVDRLTRALLGVIAASLVVIACNMLERGTPGGSAAQAAGGLNVQVLCTSCTLSKPPGHREHAHVVLLDQSTGSIWAYEGFDSEPMSLGKLKLSQ